MNEARVLRLKVDIGKVIDAIDARTDGFLLWRNSEEEKKAIFKEIWKWRYQKLVKIAKEMYKKYE